MAGRRSPKPLIEVRLFLPPLIIMPELKTIESRNFANEYLSLPVLPYNLSPSLESTHGSLENFEEWYLPQMLRVVTADPGWLKDLEWATASHGIRKEKVQAALALLPRLVFTNSQSKFDHGYFEKEVKKITDIAGNHHAILPALHLRGLELLHKNYPYLSYFWRGGNYGEGENQHYIKGREFSLSRKKAMDFLTITRRKSPCIYRLHILRAVSGFRQNKILVKDETADIKSFFGYSALITFNDDARELGLEAFRVTSKNTP